MPGEVDLWENPEVGDVGLVPADPEVRAFHRKLPGYRPSPLLDLPGVAAELGVARVLAKVESERFGLPAFKMLGASWATYRALVRRLGAEPRWSTIEDLATAVAPLAPLRLTTATDGNHGRAVALMARLLGLECTIFVPADIAPARADAIASEGAAVVRVDGHYDDAVARAAATASPSWAVISDTSWEGYTAVPRDVISGYATIFEEVDEELGGHGRAGHGRAGPTTVVVQSGVGALAAAAATHWRAPDRPRARLLCVEPTDAACVLKSCRAGRPVVVPGPHRSIMAGLNCGTPSVVAFPSILSGFDLCVSIPDEYAVRAMRSLAAAGVVAGETGGAGLAGCLALAEDPRGPTLGVGPDDTLVILVTEGATDPVNYRHLVGVDPFHARH